MADLVSLGRSAAVHARIARADLGIALSELSGVFSLPIVQANSFNKKGGQLVTAGTTWILSSSADPDRVKAASGLVIKARSDMFWVASLYGMPVERLAHGLGSAPSLLWLQTDSLMGISRPTSSSGKILQRVGKIWGPDLICLMIEHPTLV